VITRGQVIECGIPESTVGVWVRPGGKWQKLLPGIYLAELNASISSGLKRPRLNIIAIPRPG
jgi:hypothetical protein